MSYRSGYSRRSYVPRRRAGTYRNRYRKRYSRYLRRAIPAASASRELKFYSTDALDIGDPQLLARYGFLSFIDQGVAHSERIGNKITPVYLKVTITLKVPAVYVASQEPICIALNKQRSKTDTQATHVDHYGRVLGDQPEFGKNLALVPLSIVNPTTSALTFTRSFFLRFRRSCYYDGTAVSAGDVSPYIVGAGATANDITWDCSYIVAFYDN